MAKKADVNEALAKFEDWRARTVKTAATVRAAGTTAAGIATNVVKSPDVMAAQARRVGRGAREVGRRLRNMLFGTVGVLVLAFLYGNLVNPLGFFGVAVTAMLILCVLVFFATYAGGNSAKVLEKLPETPLAALPEKVETWLETQRPALPAPAAREVDGLILQLDKLAPELKQLDPLRPEADEVRRLISDHLPRLVKSYADVPISHRNTPEAQRHFSDGIKVVGAEITRLKDDLARERLRALETEGRFLESRYKR